MANEVTISAAVRKNWEEVQKRHDVPVNAIGIKIDARDQATLKIRKDLGIDKCMTK